MMPLLLESCDKLFQTKVEFTTIELKMHFSEKIFETLLFSNINKRTLLDLLSRPSAWASSHLRFCYLYQRRPPSRLRQRLDNHVRMPHEGGCCRNGHMLLTTWLRVNHSAVPVNKRKSKHYSGFFHFESNSFFYIDNVFMVLHGGPIENSSVLFIYAEYVGSRF